MRWVGPSSASLRLAPVCSRVRRGLLQRASCMSAELGGAHFLSSFSCMLVVSRANYPFQHVFSLFPTATRERVCVCASSARSTGREQVNSAGRRWISEVIMLGAARSVELSLPSTIGLGTGSSGRWNAGILACPSPRSNTCRLGTISCRRGRMPGPGSDPRSPRPGSISAFLSPRAGAA